MGKTFLLRSAALATVIGLGLATASAQTFLFDFGRSTNNTTNPTGGLFYNNINLSTTLAGTVDQNFTSLITNANTTTAVALNINKAGGAGTLGSAAVGADWTGTKPAQVSGFAATALSDGFVVNGGGTYTLTFSGLTAPGYDLSFYGARGNNSTNATYQLVTGSVGSGGSGANATFNGFENSTTVVNWSNIVPVGGVIAFSITDTTLNQQFTGSTPTNTNVALNFGSITAVPEPSAYAVIALGCVGLIVVRRMKMRRAA